MLIAASAKVFLSSLALPGLWQLSINSIWDVSSVCFSSITPALQTSSFPQPLPSFPAQTCLWLCSSSLPVLILLCCVIWGLSPLKPKENAEGRCRRSQEVQGSSSQLPQEDQGSFVGSARADQAQWWGYKLMALQHPSRSPSPGCLIAMQHLSLLCCPISH